jgi:hypothetical protein
MYWVSLRDPVRGADRVLDFSISSVARSSERGLKAIAIYRDWRRGTLFYHLCTHLNWIDLYPINPHSLVSFRLTFFSNRGKDDPIDSQLPEEPVRTHSDRLHPYQRESTTERKLDQYCRHRRSLLDLATKPELKVDFDSEAIFSFGRQALRRGRHEVWHCMELPVAPGSLRVWPILEVR